MAIHCPNCLQSFSARDELNGKRVKCPKCKERFTVPGKAEVDPAELGHDSTEDETPQRISMNTSILAIIKVHPTRLVGGLMPLAILVLVQDNLSQPVMIAFGAACLLTLGTLPWNVYQHKGCWIQFGREDISFRMMGEEQTLDLADLVSIHCPTADHRRYGDFVHLKFKSGSKVRLWDYSPGFEEAKDALMRQLAHSRSVKDCVVVGDFEMPRRVVSTAVARGELEADQLHKSSDISFKPSNLAARGSRFSATGIDLAICFALTQLLVPFAKQMLESIRPAHQGIMQTILLHLMVIAVAYLVVNGYLLATRGQSIGKWLFGIQIVDATTDELIPLRTIATQRVIPVFLALAAATIVMPRFIGLLWLLILIDLVPIFGQEQRCIHDMLARSKVINVS